MWRSYTSLSAPSGSLVIALLSIQSLLTCLSEEKYGKQLKFAEQARCFYGVLSRIRDYHEKVGCTSFFD